jgi:hypothetical protein
MKDSNLQPPDEEIPGRVSNFNDFGNFNGSNRVKMGQTEPQNTPLARLKNRLYLPGIGRRTPFPQDPFFTMKKAVICTGFTVRTD